MQFLTSKEGQSRAITSMQAQPRGERHYPATVNQVVAIVATATRPTIATNLARAPAQPGGGRRNPSVRRMTAVTLVED